MVVLSATTGRVLWILDTHVAVVRGLPSMAVTSDGRTVFYSRSRSTKPGECTGGFRLDEVAEVPVTGGNPASVSPGVYPVISPNGRYLAFVRNLTDPCDTDHNELVVRDLVTGVDRAWAPSARNQLIDLSYLSWAPNSVHLGFDADNAHGAYGPRVLDTLTARTLDDSQPIPQAPNSAWDSFLGSTGSNLAVRDLHGPNPEAVQLNATTGAVQQVLVALSGDLWTDNSLDGPEGTIQSDRSGTHLLILTNNGLYQWTAGQHAATLVTTDAIRAVWVP
jgi:hypothetical protein